MKIKLLPRDNKTRTQEQAIEYHNSRKEVMLSFQDVFNLDKDQLEELRKDWKGWNWLVTSTRIDYSKNTVTHYVDSKVIKPIVIKLKEIPICQPIYIKELLSTQSGLDYVRALINQKKATKEKIISEFERISGKNADNIRFWTPTETNRKERPLRAVLLNFYVGRFYVVGNDWFDDGNGDVGFSRGVLVSSAIFSNKAIFDIEEKTITIPMQRKLRKEIEQQQKKTKKVSIWWDLKTKIS